VAAKNWGGKKKTKSNKLDSGTPIARGRRNTLGYENPELEIEKIDPKTTRVEKSVKKGGNQGENPG